MPSLLPRLKNFIHRFDERLAHAEKAASEAWWNLATTGTEEAQGELVRVGMAYNKLFADKDEYELVKGWYERRASLESSILRRQVEILYKTFARRQGYEGTLRRIEELEAEANAIYSNHRGAVEQQTFPISLTMLLTDTLRMSLLRREKRGIANIGFESFLINLYVACFALIALTG